MIRRKPTHPSANGAAPGSGYGQVGYGAPSGNVGPGVYGSHGGYGNGADPQAGGYGYGNAHSHTPAVGHSAATAGPSSAAPRYTGYGTSVTSTSSGGGGGFGVGMGGEASYGESPYASDDRSSFKGKKKKKSSFSSTISLKLLKDKVVIASLVAFFMFGLTMYYRSQYHLILKKLHVQTMVEAVKSYEKLELEKKKFQKEAISAKENDRNMKNSIRELEKVNRELRKQQDELKVKYETVGGIEVQKNEKLKGRDDAWRNQVYLLQNATQRESKRAVLERFGPGPHHVRFTVEFPTEKDPPERGTFVVELAPLDLLPHANHLFLEQVYHELWDGTWIYLNGPHVLQAGPQDWDEETNGESLKRFTESKLDKLSFPEYSEQFPHLPWTLGFTGRPGGPDWYINKVDNTKSHGPHGQFQHKLEEQADSCFAKVVEGQDTLQKVFSAEVYPRDSDWAFFLEDAIEIVTARIVEPISETVNKPKHTLSSGGVHTARKIKLPQRTDNNQESIDAEKAEQIAKMMDHIGKTVRETTVTP